MLEILENLDLPHFRILLATKSDQHSQQATQRNIMEMPLRVGDIVLVEDKDKAYINRSGKDSCVTVFYLFGTCQKKVSWNLRVSYFMQNQKKEIGV